jgi:hypothetical protein
MRKVPVFVIAIWFAGFANADLGRTELKLAQIKANTVFPFNQFTSPVTSGDVIVVGGTGQICDSGDKNCRRADYLLHIENDPEVYKRGNYIYNDLFLTLDGDNEINRTIKGCIVHQALEVQKLDSLIPGSNQIFKFLQVDSPIFVEVYTAHKIEHEVRKSFFNEVGYYLKSIWGSGTPPLLTAENSLSISIFMVVNLDQQDPCSIISAQEIVEKLKGNMNIVGDTSKVY